MSEKSVNDNAPAALPKWIVIATSLVVIGIVAAIVHMEVNTTEGLPKLFSITEFSLTDEHGIRISSRDLRGKVWIADFIFTSCPDICPMLTTQLANVERHFRDEPDVRFVSITVDPEVDTPARLLSYANEHHADLSRWSFLTGTRAEVGDVTEKIFKQPFEAKVPSADGKFYSIMHAGRLMLMDKQSTLRGIYETTPEGLRQLEKDARALSAE